jgi:hypothetical protein
VLQHWLGFVFEIKIPPLNKIEQNPELTFRIIFRDKLTFFCAILSAAHFWLEFNKKIAVK